MTFASSVATLLLLVPSIVLPAVWQPSEPAVAGCRRGADLPAQFPFDAFVLRAEVMEPVLPLEPESTEAWVVRVELAQPVFVPESRRRFDLLLHNDDCSFVSRQQLIDLFVSGDTLEIAAFAAPAASRAPLLLAAPVRWVRLMDENTSREIDTPFEYFAALLDLEGREDDSHRALGMRRIANYLETEDQFDAVLDAYIDGKRLKKQLRSVYRSLHPSD